MIGVSLGLNAMVVLLGMILLASHLGSNKSNAWLSLPDSFRSYLQIIDSKFSFNCFIVARQLFWKFTWAYNLSTSAYNITNWFQGDVYCIKDNFM